MKIIVLVAAILTSAVLVAPTVGQPSEIAAHA